MRDILFFNQKKRINDKIDDEKVLFSPSPAFFPHHSLLTKWVQNRKTRR
jgi:hypothetical protein